MSPVTRAAIPIKCVQETAANKLHQRRPQILSRMTMSMLMTILIIMKMMMVVLRMTTTIMTVIAVIMTI